MIGIPTSPGSHPVDEFSVLRDVYTWSSTQELMLAKGYGCNVELESGPELLN